MSRMIGKFNHTKTHDIEMWHHPNDPIHKATKEERMLGFQAQLKDSDKKVKELVRILNDGFDGKYEVKSERMYSKEEDNQKKWMNTGNMYIEYSSRGKTSGLSDTEGHFWIHSFYNRKNEMVYAGIFITAILKQVLLAVSYTHLTLPTIYSV